MRTSKIKSCVLMLSLSSLVICTPLMAMQHIYANSIYKVDQDNKVIKGKIIDSSGNPLPGVNIVNMRTNKGVISDADGYYLIQAQKGDILNFSFIGYKGQKIKVENKLAIDISMSEETTMLNETVVVGMGTQRKASVVGAISSVDLGDIKMPERSLTSALSGRIAGATIVQRSGEPGYDEPSFWIRGISTFGADQSPLILVDGVERSMSNLPIEEIESISILKDASATAVYGVRAANGVVLITTKKGLAQKPVIVAKVEYGISDLPNMPKFLDGANYAKLYNEAFGQENYSQEYIENVEKNVNRFLWPNVNWFNEIFKKYSNNMNASININGGGERARYFINAGYYGDQGNFKDYDLNDYKSNIHLNRYNFRSNVDVTITRTTTLNLEIGANLTNIHEPGVGNEWIYSTWYGSPAEELFHWAYLSTPLSCPVRVPIKYNGNGMVKEWGWGAPSQIGEMNPAERLFGSGYNTRFTSEVTSQIILNQDLSFLTKGLNIKGYFSFDTNNNTIQTRHKTSSTYSVAGTDDDTGYLITKEVNKGDEFLGYGTSSSSTRAMEAKAQLNYDRLFNNTHHIGSMLMYYQRDYVNGSASSSIYSLPYRKQGIAYRLTYAYKDTYLGEFNLGYNGSENFPKHKRFGFFPAFAAGYLISNESFWKSKIISELKLRGSIGLVGSDALPSNMRYGYLSTWGSGLGGYAFGMTPSSVNGVGESQIGVSNLTWEKGLKKDLGIDLRMFNNDISLVMDYFHEKRTDILIQRQSISAIAGLNSAPFANMGKMVNHGIETTLELSHKFKKMYYKLYGNFTFTKNKILEEDEPKMKYAYRMRTGHRYGQQFGLVALGLFKDQNDINNSPEQTFGTVRPGDVKYKDVNKDGVIDINDEQAIGYSSIPEIVYGFGLQVMWNRFDLGIFFRGQSHVSYALGGAFIPFNQGVGKGNLFKKAMDRWTTDNPNPNAFYPRLSNGINTNDWQASSRNIYDGSFLRLANMEIGYTFSKKILSQLKIEGLRIYIIGDNLALISKWHMWDPETGTAEGDHYPLARKINFGVRVTI